MSSSGPASVPHRTPLRVGELAGATGLTVRTLHYYEEIGLLVPSTRTAAGHRLYESHDVERLYRIRLLRNLGLSLDDVAKSLDRPDWSFERGLRSHLRDVEQTIARATQMRNQLAAVFASVEASDDVDAHYRSAVAQGATIRYEPVDQPYGFVSTARATLRVCSGRS